MEEVLEQFWEAVKQERDMVHRDQVIAINVLLIKCLWPPDEWDEDDAKEVAQEDWDREMDSRILRTDRRSRNRMGKAEFLDSIREVADLWCPDVGAVEYRTFLQKLLLDNHAIDLDFLPRDINVLKRLIKFKKLPFSLFLYKDVPKVSWVQLDPPMQ